MCFGSEEYAIHPEKCGACKNRVFFIFLCQLSDILISTILHCLTDKLFIFIAYEMVWYVSH